LKFKRRNRANPFQSGITDVEVLKRLRDYDNADPVDIRRQLTERWQKAYPEAAKENSAANKPLVLLQKREGQPDRNPLEPKLPDEEWHNDTYQVNLRRWSKDPVFGTRSGMIQIGISAIDGTARHDWREFQAIKNQLAGEDCEAFELYPAESRLLDPSNYYTLWCFPGVKRLQIGHSAREVLDRDESFAPQRQLPKGA